MKKNNPRKKKRFEDRLPLIMAFALPVLIMLGVCAGNGIYPFGNSSFLRTDLYHQYAPFYANLASRLKSGESLTYAWDIGLGSNYLAVIAYYLMCPTQLLLFLIPDSFIIEYITIMIILKIGLSGYTFAKYLSIKHRTNNLGIAFFAVCYALSGYTAAYSWNIMWLDCFLLAPVIILGLEKLVREHRPWVYCWSMALAILTNYYIGIMLCIFAVIYFIGLLFMEPARRFTDYLKEIGLFGLYSLIAGGLTMFIVLPAALELMTTYASTSASGEVTATLWDSVSGLFAKLPKSWEQYCSIFEVSARHLTAVKCEVGLAHWPNIYSGAATLVFLPMYYMNRRVNYKEKIVKTVILFIMLASFSLNIPNYIWHGMRLPNSLPARQSFLYTLLILSMCFEGFKGFKGITKGKLAGIFFGAAGFILLLQQIVGVSEEVPIYAYYLTLFFAALYCLCLYVYKNGKAGFHTAFSLIMAVLIIELGVNTAITSVHTSNRDYYIGKKPEYQQLLRETADGSFYRVEKARTLTNNDGPWTGYSSASLFSSTTPDALRTFYKKMGMKASVNAYSRIGATPFADSLLGVRYILSEKEIDCGELWTLAQSVDGAYIYENMYALPLGFMIPSDANELWSFTSSNPVKAQNSLANILGEGADLLHSIPGTTSDKEYSTSVTTRSHVYIYVENSSITSVTANIGDETKTFSDLKHNYLLDLGYCDAGTDILLTNGDDQTFRASAYSFDDAAFITLQKQLADEPFVTEKLVSTLGETSLSGTVNAAQDGALFLSVPYDRGWTIKVDGSITEAEKFSDAFILLPLTAGEHTIEMSYSPEGFRTGILLSLCSLGALILCIAAAIVMRIIRKKHAPEPEPEGPDELLEIPEDTDDTEDTAEPETVLTVDEAVRSSVETEIGDESDDILSLDDENGPKVPLPARAQYRGPAQPSGQATFSDDKNADEEDDDREDIEDENADDDRSFIKPLSVVNLSGTDEGAAKDEDTDAPLSVVNLDDLADDDISDTVDLSYLFEKPGTDEPGEKKKDTDN